MIRMTRTPISIITVDIEEASPVRHHRRAASNLAQAAVDYVRWADRIDSRGSLADKEQLTNATIVMAAMGKPTVSGTRGVTG
jgi:hypothetical protein